MELGDASLGPLVSACFSPPGPHVGLIMDTTLMQEIPPEQSLIEYPSKFPIKVMGLNVDGFVTSPTPSARQFAPDFDASTVELRPSKTDKYLGVTLIVTATSREQLDELYRTLTTHPMVKVVL